MKRDIAIRLDALLIGARVNLDMIAAYMKSNLSEEEFKTYIKSIGKSMGELAVMSMDLHSLFPDIVPDEYKTPRPK